MRRFLGIDLAVTAEHRACLCDETGQVLAQWRLRMRRAELEALHERAVEGMGAGDLLVVVMESTANSWVAPAGLLAAKGASVHLVHPEQSADLRRYYAKHVKNDRIDAKLLARMPLLHPEGMTPAPLPHGARGTLKRIVARRARLAKECARHRQRIRSMLHLAMPEMPEALGEEIGKGALAVLGRYGDPNRLLRLGRARLTQVLIKATRGQWREANAQRILDAARAAIELWDGLDGCEFTEIAEDLAAEVRIIRVLEAEMRELDTRAAGLLDEIDPQGLVRSLPGFAERTATTVAGRLGDPSRFASAAKIRAFAGVVPGTNQSGESEAPTHLSKHGDRVMRTALFLAAEAARHLDPQLAQIYHRQMVDKGAHHTKAVCAVATAIASRLAAVLRDGRAYEIRDLDGNPVDRQTAREIIAGRFTVTAQLRQARHTARSAQRMKGRPAGGVRSGASLPPPPADEAPSDAIQEEVGGLKVP
jgi:transposase